MSDSDNEVMFIEPLEHLNSRVDVAIDSNSDDDDDEFYCPFPSQQQTEELQDTVAPTVAQPPQPSPLLPLPTRQPLAPLPTRDNSCNTATQTSQAYPSNSSAPLPPQRKRHWFCYLLRSKSPAHPYVTYIGFTVNPNRRLRQHNGELSAGAKRTHKCRPWEFVCVLHGFPSKHHALMFEWHWQHPRDSLKLRMPLRAHPSLGRSCGFKAKLHLARLLLQQPPFDAQALDVRFALASSAALCSDISVPYTVGPISEWPLLGELDSTGGQDDDEEDEEDKDEDGHTGSENSRSVDKENKLDSMNSSSSSSNVRRNRTAATAAQKHDCSTCSAPLGGVEKVWRCPPPCNASSHLCCLALASLAHNKEPRTKLVPKDGRCESCGFATPWGNIVLGVKTNAGR